MGRKSTITKLDPKIRAEIDRIIREGGYTVDGLLELLKTLGGEASRAAVGRYAKNQEQQIKDLREMQALAKSWIGELKADPEGDVGRLLSQLLQRLIYMQMNKASDSERTGALDVALLSRALKDLAGTDKLTLERIEKVKHMVLAEAAERVGDAAKAQGLDAEQAGFWRRKVLGVR